MLRAAPAAGRRCRAAAALAALAAAALVAFAPRGGAAPVRTTACADTCGTARDGVCDEGRPAAGALPNTPPSGGYWNVTCDLGTDCNDCGAWTSAGTAEAAAWRPVAEILAAGYSLRAKAAAFSPNLPDRPAAFVFGYTDPLHDVDVSHHFQEHGLVEGAFSAIWHRLLAASAPGGGCAGARGGALVVDVGANFGWFSLLAASLGCRVLAFEPVPRFSAYFKYSLQRNGLSPRVELREALVGEAPPGAELEIVAPNRGIWGTAGIGGGNLDKNIPNDGEYERLIRRVERLDDAVPASSQVLVLKADVEGFEPGVFRGAARLLARGGVDNIIMEYSPGVAERMEDWQLNRAESRMLLDLVDAGFAIAHLDPGRIGWPGPWAGPTAAPLEEVSRRVLEHDAFDAAELGAQPATLGCPLPEGLAGRIWDCGNLPQALHPRSFHSTFGHNTNVWARRGGAFPAFARIEGEAALFNASYDFKTQFFAPAAAGGAPTLGAGRRVCAHVEAQYKVAHRCPCPPEEREVCGALADEVARLAAAGRLVPRGPAA